MPTAIFNHGGESFLDAIPNDNHGFAYQGFLRVEVINQESRLAANLGGQRAKGEVGDPVFQHVLDGGVEENCGTGRRSLLHVTTVT